MDKFLEIIAPIMNLNVLALCVISFFAGLLVMLLDRIYFSIKRTSLLQIAHKTKFIKDITTMLLWSLGAAIVGLIGGLFRIFSTEGLLQTSLFIAISWPLILKNIIKNASKKAGEKQQIKKNNP